MKNIVLIVILSTLSFQLFSAEVIQNNTNNYFISTSFDLIKLKNTDFKFGKKNDWGIKWSYQFQSKPYYEHNTTTEVANISLFYQLDSLWNYNLTIELNIGLFRSVIPKSMKIGMCQNLVLNIIKSFMKEYLTKV